MENSITAVEWFVNKLEGFHDHFSLAFSKEINKAKEMEKEQILKAYNSGELKGIEDMIDFEPKDENESSEDYYNKTYKKTR